MALVYQRALGIKSSGSTEEVLRWSALGAQRKVDTLNIGVICIVKVPNL